MKHSKLMFVVLSFATFILLFASCNSNGNKAKPETSSTIAQDQRSDLTIDSMYTCKMHNEVMSDHPGKCPRCGMKLSKEKMTAAQLKMMKDNTYTKPKE